MQPTNEEKSIKKLRCIQRSVDRHWVGNGFPVRTLFAYPNLGSVLSPFLLLDYAGPMEFSPTNERRGVGEHPHRGFETVTIVYEGEVEHRDSSGGGGRIGPDDVEWMTAASGLVHEEFHGREFARRGGMFEMVQLWVNLPAKDKMAPPRYQSIVSSQIPTLGLRGRQGDPVWESGCSRCSGNAAAPSCPWLANSPTAAPFRTCRRVARNRDHETLRGPGRMLRSSTARRRDQYAH